MNHSETDTAPVVAVIRCNSYKEQDVANAVTRAITLLGGTAAFANSGEKLLFKPNVLWGTDPAMCVVTHPAVLRAAVAAFSSTGTHLYYGDSPAGLQQALPTMKKCGYDTALANLPVQLIPFDKGTTVAFPAGAAGKQLQIATAVLDADGIINLPKLKTHGLTRMTGAIKNLYGCIPPLVKGEYHARFPDVYDFSLLLADIATFIRPRLHIMDAVEAMEGNGPQSGTPRKLGVILASADPVALDTIACRLIGLDPTFVPTIAAAQKTGLGCGNPNQITLVGDSITPLICTTFDVVRKPPVSLPQNTLLGAIKRLFLPRPVIKAAICTRCGRCVSMCPLSPPALLQKSIKSRPSYNYATCIRCYCCQEVCPSKAIVIKNPIFRTLLPFATYFSLFITRIRTHRHIS